MSSDTDATAHCTPKGWAALLRVPPKYWCGLIRACVELAYARFVSRQQPLDRFVTISPVSLARDLPVDPARCEVLERVGFCVSRAGARMPWRSDCLIQALAAKRWLASKGICSDLHVGVRKDGAAFAAHAWLVADGVLVTGGDISGFSAFGDSGAADRDYGPARPGPGREYETP